MVCGKIFIRVNYLAGALAGIIKDGVNHVNEVLSIQGHSTLWRIV